MSAISFFRAVPNERIKICLVGGEDVHFRIPLIIQLRLYNFEVEAIGSKAGIPFKLEGIKYHQNPLNRNFNPLADIKFILQLLKIFRKSDVHIVHFFDTKPGVLGPIAAKCAGTPVVIRTIAGMGYIYSSSDKLAKILKPIYLLSQSIASRLCNTTVFQNPDDTEYFIAHKMVCRKAQTIIRSSGVDSSHYNRNCLQKDELKNLKKKICNANARIVILVSRLVRDKGIYEYLEAARLVRTKHPETIFLLVGPLASEGKQAVSKDLIKRYSNDILYLGKRDDIRELLAISDIFVLPTYYREGVPRVLMEAGLMGLPLITTDMPGCREIVRHNWNGLLVQPKKPVALAQSIEILLENQEERVLMGQRNKTYIAENFDLKLVAASHAALYNRLLKVKNSGLEPV